MLRKQDNSNAIQLIHVSKKYELHHEKPTLLEKFIKKKNETFWALTDINLTIKKGEKVGIIGPNGAGKTTLLKVITGITTPTTGTITTHGKIVSLIDLDAGFHPDLTGIQNIYLNGMLLGMKHYEIEHVLNNIVQFADIGQFIDAPLFTYSMGMRLRLGFSIAINSNPDILIIDEGIGAGDKYFQKKSQSKIKEIFKKDKTIIVATHWMEFLKKTTNYIIEIQNGVIVKKGSTKILENY